MSHGQHEQREGHDRVGDAADDAIRPAAEKSGGDAGEPTHEKDQRDGGDGDEKIEPRRHHDAAEHVAAELVGPEPMRARRRLERRRRIARERVIGHEIRTEQGREHDHEKQREGKTGHRVLAQNVTSVPQHGARRRARLRASVTSAFTRVCRRAGDANVNRVAALGARFVRQRDVAHASILTRGSIRP
jgi:hypothetical protein